jgi:ParB/RepB/Spo0J family partition protein
MASITDLAGVTRANAYNIPPEVLQQGDHSRRWDDTDIVELADDILNRGQLVPALINRQEDGTITIVDGNRRVAAIRYINENKPPAAGPLLVRCEPYRGGKGDTFAASVSTNLKRKGLTPIDLAHSITILERQGKTRKEIGKLLEISESLISQTLKLTTLPADIQRRVHKGEIPASAAYELADMPKEHRDEALDLVKKGRPKASGGETASGSGSFSSGAPAPVTAREAVRRVKREKAEKGEEVAGPTQRSRKEIVNLFTEWSGCEDGTIEEDILKFCKTMVDYMAGKVGDRAVLNRLRELKDE